MQILVGAPSATCRLLCDRLITTPMGAGVGLLTRSVPALFLPMRLCATLEV